MKTREAIARLSAYHAGIRRAGALKLSSNENPAGPSPRAMEAARAALDETHIYPDGGAVALRERIAARHNVSSNQIIVGNGSDEVLTLIAATYVDEASHVLIPEVTFSQYRFAATLFGGEVETVEMPALAIDPVLMAQRVRANTRIVFVCSPNNPTGGVVAHERFADALRSIPDDVLVVVDHAYQEYVDDPAALDGHQYAGSRENLIVLRTFSKVFGLAALRVGYGVAHPERIAEMSRARSPFNVGTVAQAAALAALDDDDFVARSLAENAAGRASLVALASSLGLDPLPTQGNFVTIEAGLDARTAASWFEDNGITVRALSSFGLPSRLRITVPTPGDLGDLEALLRRWPAERERIRGAGAAAGTAR